MTTSRYRLLAAMLTTGILCSSGMPRAAAQVVSEGHVDYALGALQVHETPAQLSIIRNGILLQTSAVKPGGGLDPDVHVDEEGILTAGPLRLDVRTGKSVTPPRARVCKGMSWPKSALVAQRQTYALVLRPLQDKDGRSMGYASSLLNLASCRQIARSIITAQESDNFFEFRSSSKGWWLVGSQDATVLITSSGKAWRRLTLPPDVHNVLTANWASDNVFWVLANKLTGTDLTPVFYKTSDLGHTWAETAATIDNLPGYWFEARREIAAAEQH